MSYEIWAFDAARVATADAAGKAWEESTYENSSLPDHERTARKWQIKDELLAFNPELIFREPKAKGLLSKLVSEDEDEKRYLVLCRPPAVSSVDDDGRGIDFCVYDQALEINLPWDVERGAVEAVMREAWRHLEKLSQLGFSTIYDSERYELLNLAGDFDAVVKRYIENLDFDDEGDPPAPSDVAFAVTKAPPGKQTPDTHTPFSGNVADNKPWWKLW